MQDDEEKEMSLPYDKFYKVMALMFELGAYERAWILRMLKDEICCSCGEDNLTCDCKYSDKKKKK